MSIFDVLTLVCGLALFLYGMEVMGDALKKSAGSSLKMILGKLTSNPVKGFLLGLVVTAVIQSSSATTVMVVGFVNSGTMTLYQAVGVIIGANLGTAVTAWLTGLSGLGAGGEAVASYIKWLKPDAWMPILALIGIILLMFAKRSKKKDMGTILLGFAVLMVGMSLMSDAVAGLKNDEGFHQILLMFENPILGVLAGLVLTAIVQSSSASIGILQSLTVTGAISFGAAIPIIMGQNIGTCVTAMISSFGANTNGKRAAVIHLMFNVIGVVIGLALFYALNAIFKFAFVHETIDMWGVAFIHTAFKIFSIAIIGPFNKQLVKLSERMVRPKKDENETISLLDERLLDTPGVAVARATEVTGLMAGISTEALLKSLDLAENYDVKLADEIRELEDKADKMEDALGTYLVKLSSQSMNEKDSEQITKLLHIIGDYERISDHAVNIVESAEELTDKKIEFSVEAQKELLVLRNALREILALTCEAYTENDLSKAAQVEPIEQVVDDLMDQIKLNHIRRLQKSECTIELGFVLNDFLVNFERVSDHCSNIASCIIEISQFGALDMHKYLADLRAGSENYEQKYKEYKRKYNI
ncbi:MAG: Na/Pi cotransporter family protein [Christensenellaceae bacterium]|nr:Na/Pi cotransporter family protein [Christensenellaceae bacterium]